MIVIPTAFDQHDPAGGRACARMARVLCAAALACAIPAAVLAQRVPPARDAAALRAELRAELQRLAASLDSTGAELARVDERVGVARATVRQETGGPLVVLLRAEPGATATLSGATVEVDDARGPSRRYDAAEREALRAGAADELFRTALAPGAHAVRATVSAAGGTATRTATVDAPAPSAVGRATYVEFVLRDGRLDAATWVADAPTAPRR